MTLDLPELPPRLGGHKGSTFPTTTLDTGLQAPSLRQRA